MPLRGLAADLPRPFGPYTLLRRLAVGGMAEVYVAKAKGIGGFEKLVAIKVIHPRYSEDDHFVQMLVEEAKLSVLLNHVNIAQTFDLGVVETPNAPNTYFIVMEFIEGADAYRLLKKAAPKRAKIPIDLCAYVVSEVCHGLDYAHRKRDMTGSPLNIVHRDISPQNVLISFSGEVKIVDFGIAKAAMRSGEATEVGVIKGKYYYMSPEQAWGDPVDSRSDIFSTGIVLYELLTGEMLYQQDSLPKLLDAVRKADVEPPSRKRPDIPPELDEIVMRALSKHSNDRYRSAHDFGQALTSFLYKRMPSFTAARMATLMAQLFPKELEQATGSLRVSSDQHVIPLSDSGQKIVTDTGTGSLEVMKPDEFRPDILARKSKIYDLKDGFEGEETREAGGRRKPPSQSKPQSPPKREPPRIQADDSTEEDVTLVESDVRPAADDWDDPTTSMQPTPLMSFGDEDSWGDRTMVDDKGEILQRMKHALEREVAQRNKQKKRAPRPAPPAPAPVPRSAPPRSAPRSAPPPPPPKPSAPPPVASAALRIPREIPTEPPTPVIAFDASDESFESAITTPEQEEPWSPVVSSGGLPDLSGKWEDDSATPNPHSVLPSVSRDQMKAAAQLETLEMDKLEVSTESGETVLGKRLIVGLVLVALVLGGVLVARALTGADAMLNVTSNPPGAEVFLDGDTLGQQTPLVGHGPLEDGHEYDLEVVLVGYEPYIERFTATEGLTTRAVELTPMRRNVTIDPGATSAQVFVDGVLHGRSSTTLEALEFGRELEIRVVYSRSRTVTQTVVVSDDLPDPVTIRAR